MTLRDARKRLGLTQEQLATISGVGQTTISQLETGGADRPAWDVVGRLSAALGVEPEEIWPLSMAVQGPKAKNKA